MEEITQFNAREDNDNMPIQIGDWVDITNESFRPAVEAVLGSGPPYVIARVTPHGLIVVAKHDYPKVKGVYIPDMPSQRFSKPFPYITISRSMLKLLIKPGAVPTE